MLNNDINSTGGKGVWSPTALKVISILFSYLAVFIFYILNYIRLGHPKEEQRVKILAIIAMAYILLAVALAKSLYISPVFIFVNIILGIVISNDQMELYTNHINNGGTKKSNLTLTFLSIGTFIGVMLIVSILMLVFEIMFKM